MPESIPVVVDLDGTLTPVDTLFEGALAAVRARPACLFGMLLALLRGRASLKHYVSERAVPDMSTLPWRTELLDELRARRAAGSRIVLATAANERVAQAAATHLGLFDAVLASSDQLNLKGRAKLAAIQQQFGDRFIYAGDSSADLPIWAQAQGAILEIAPRRSGLALWLRALRWHQWAKNLLIFVPLLAALGTVQPGGAARAVLAFVAFCLVASATYVGNDLWDLQHDRAHPRKRQRPMASGAIPIAQAVAVSLGVLLIGFAMASLVSGAFLAMVLVYFALTCAYSWVLKTYVLVDVLVLAMLYTLRVIAGAVAIQAPVSHWLLVFSTLVFFSLALVKRCSELVSRAAQGGQRASGRDYGGVGAALSSIVVFCLFIDSPATQQRYGSPQSLWLGAVALTYLLSRLWVKTARKEMHDDPIVYTLRDRASLIMVTIMAVSVALAHLDLQGLLP
jgi:4-hydroxybenzoate polyprenyltransferase/phosphoserine phosphatase